MIIKKCNIMRECFLLFKNMQLQIAKIVFMVNNIDRVDCQNCLKWQSGELFHMVKNLSIDILFGNVFYVFCITLLHTAPTTCSERKKMLAIHCCYLRAS